MNGDFELSLIKKNNKFEWNLVIHFNNDSKIDKKEFSVSNYKKLLKKLKSLIKTSIDFHDYMMYLENLKGRE